MHGTTIKVILKTFVVRARKMQDMQFKTNRSNAARNTAGKVLCSPSKVPLIIYRTQSQVHLM